jgi:hypothetical protein
MVARGAILVGLNNHFCGRGACGALPKPHTGVVSRTLRTLFQGHPMIAATSQWCSGTSNPTAELTGDNHAHLTSRFARSSDHLTHAHGPKHGLLSPAPLAKLVCQ